jgi:hypothetical protein
MYEGKIKHVKGADERDVTQTMVEFYAYYNAEIFVYVFLYEHVYARSLH